MDAFRSSMFTDLRSIGVPILKEKDFESDPKGISKRKGHFAMAFPAIQSGDPSRKVTIKVLQPSVRLKILLSSQDQDQEDAHALLNKTLQYFKRECGVLHSTSHRNIIKFLGVLTSFEGSELPAIVTVTASNGTLRQFVSNTRNPPSFKDRLKLMHDVGEGLAFLHSRYVIHRDLKAENVMIDYRDSAHVALLGDFGSAKDFTGEFAVFNSSSKSSVLWSAPEYINNPRLFTNESTGSGDMWSYGCTLLEVLVGLSPPWPPHYSYDDSVNCIRRGKHPPRPTPYDVLPNGLWDFMVDACWCIEPGERISAREACVVVQGFRKEIP